jgi:hypothetical protein
MGHQRKPFDPAKLAKRQFELKLKLSLEKQKLNYDRLTVREKLYFRIIELKKRQNRDLCPACLVHHFTSPPDSCWLFVSQCENSELREMFYALCRRKRWAAV